jgi:hypothetical protein
MSILSASGPEMRDWWRATSTAEQVHAVPFELPARPQGHGFIAPTNVKRAGPAMVVSSGHERESLQGSTLFSSTTRFINQPWDSPVQKSHEVSVPGGPAGSVDPYPR